MTIEIDSTGLCTPNPGGQAAFAADWGHFMVALEGGWMSGKTWIGARKLITLHVHNAFDRRGRATFIPSAVVAPTYANALDFDVPELQNACDETGLKYEWRGPGPIAAGRFYGPAMIFPDLGSKKKPSVILIRTADAPERITGWQVGASWGDEPPRWKEDETDPKRDPLLQLTSRVRHPQANLLQMLFTYTNEGDATRIYDEMHRGLAERKLYRAATIENPVARDFAKRQTEALTRELATQYLEGAAIGIRGGRVYPSFDVRYNVGDDVALRDDLPLQLSLDFNIAPGMHGEIGQHDPQTDLLWVTHELHAPRLTVRGLVGMLGRMIGKGRDLGEWRWSELQVFGDATGSSEWAATGDSCYDVLTTGLRSLGFPFRLRVPASNPPVVDRINSMEVALADMTGRVHWKCHSRCQRLIEDLRKLKRNAYGEIDKRDKRLSHPSDAEGYRVWYLRPIRRRSDEVGGRISVEAFADG